MIKTQQLFTILTFATMLSATIMFATDKKSEYANLSKELRTVASNIEHIVYNHRYKTKSAQKKAEQAATLTQISKTVASLQEISLTAVNKLKSLTRTITADPISFDDPAYKTLARSVRQIASNVDKIISEDDKNKAAKPNDALNKIASLTKQLSNITTPLAQKITPSKGFDTSNEFPLEAP